MNLKVRWGSRWLGFVRWRSDAAGSALTFRSHVEALAFLGQLAADHASMQALRQYFAEERAMGSIRSMTDAAVLDQLAHGLVQGVVYAVVGDARGQSAGPVGPIAARDRLASPPDAPALSPAAPTSGAPRALRSQTAAAAASSRRREAPQAEGTAGAPGAAGAATAVQKTWVEIALVGEDDAPLGGVRYRVELPDKRIIEGVLGEDGLVRIDDLDPGACLVSFPELDQDAWAPIS